MLSTVPETVHINSPQCHVDARRILQRQEQMESMATPCETSVTIVLSFQHIPRFDASPLLAEEALQWERA
jgi:predicted MarR family transcription regulator